MKLEKRDVAECLGLCYCGTQYNDDMEGCHTFYFNGIMIQKTSEHLNLEFAWEQAANLVLEPLVELLKGKLTA